MENNNQNLDEKQIFTLEGRNGDKLEFEYDPNREMKIKLGDIMKLRQEKMQQWHNLLAENAVNAANEVMSEIKIIEQISDMMYDD